MNLKGERMADGMLDTTEYQIKDEWFSHVRVTSKWKGEKVGIV